MLNGFKVPSGGVASDPCRRILDQMNYCDLDDRFPTKLSVAFRREATLKKIRGGEPELAPTSPLQPGDDLSVRITRRLSDEASFSRRPSVGPWDALDPWTTSPKSEKTVSPKSEKTTSPKSEKMASPKIPSPRKPRRQDPRPAIVGPTRQTSPPRPITCVPILATAPSSAPRATAWPGRQLRPLPADASASRSLRSEAARSGALVFAPGEFVPGGFRFPEPRGANPSGFRHGLTDHFHTTHCRVVTSKLIHFRE